MANQFSNFLAIVVRNAKDVIDTKAKAYAPNHLRETINSTQGQIAQGTYRITSTASGKDARAQEYGSGLRATRGPKTKYVIAPKTKRYLAFPWDVVHPFPEYQGKAVIIRYWQPEGARDKTVKHPGIPPANSGKGYMRPAGRETVEYLKKQLVGQGKIAIKAEIIAGFREKL